MFQTLYPREKTVLELTQARLRRGGEIGGRRAVASAVAPSANARQLAGIGPAKDCGRRKILESPQGVDATCTLELRVL